MKPKRFHALPALLAALALLSIPAGVAAASSAVECGQLSGYTAPDPLAPSDGSLTIGLLPAWTIAADATLSGAVEANLASIVNSGPSCLAMDLDAGGIITALDFAAQGTISGLVVVNSGFDGYVFADRLLLPTFITDAYPGLAGVFVTSAAAGSIASATFFVDTESGQFTGFSADAAFCGAGDLADNGDGLVGAATIPVDLLDADDTAALAGAGLAQACATVHSEGTIDNENDGELSITSDVTITLAPKQPDTSTVGSGAARQDSGSSTPLLALLVAGLLDSLLDATSNGARGGGYPFGVIGRREDAR